MVIPFRLLTLWALWWWHAVDRKVWVRCEGVERATANALNHQFNYLSFSQLAVASGTSNISHFCKPLSHWEILLG
jgi:hypothetical protein